MRFSRLTVHWIGFEHSFSLQYSKKKKKKEEEELGNPHISHNRERNRSEFFKIQKNKINKMNEDEIRSRSKKKKSRAYAILKANGTLDRIRAQLQLAIFEGEEEEEEELENESMNQINIVLAFLITEKEIPQSFSKFKKKINKMNEDESRSRSKKKESRAYAILKANVSVLTHRKVIIINIWRHRHNASAYCIHI